MAQEFSLESAVDIAMASKLIQTIPLKTGGMLAIIYPQVASTDNPGAPVKTNRPIKMIKMVIIKLKNVEYKKTFPACIELGDI